MTQFEDFAPEQYEAYFLEATKSEEAPSRSDTYYRFALDKIRGKGKTIVFNWPAFFFAGVWMVYRRLYGVSLFAILFSLFLKGGLSCLLAPIFQSKGWGDSLIDIVKWLIEAITYGCFMTYVYFFAIHKDLEDGRAPPKNATNLILSIMLCVFSAIIVIALDIQNIKISFIFNSGDIVEMILWFCILILFLLDRFVWRKLSVDAA